MSSSASAGDRLIQGYATPKATLRYAARFQGRAAAGHFREQPGGLVFSSSASEPILASRMRPRTAPTRMLPSLPCKVVST